MGSSGHVLGIDFGGTKVAWGVGTDDGQVLHRERVAVRAFPQAQDLVAYVLEAARRLLERHPVERIGVSTMGITTRERVLLAPNVPGWEALQLPALLEQAFPGLPIGIANDVKAACLAEMLWGALQGGDPVAYLNLGTGVALAFGAAGRVWTGAHGAAGEIAYWWEPGQLGFADGRTPLEERYGGGALDRELAQRFGIDGGLPAAMAEWGRQPEVVAWLEAAWEKLAWALGTALLVMDVSRVAAGGGWAVHLDKFGPVFRRQWARYLPFPPPLVPARFGGDAGLMGALAVGATTA